MAEKTKSYTAKFPSETIKSAIQEFRKRIGRGTKLQRNQFRISNLKGETWQLDSEDEFWVNYQGDIKSADLLYTFLKGTAYYTFSVNYRQSSYDTDTTVSISLPLRADIDLVFLLFDQVQEKYQVTNTPTIKSSTNTEKSLYTVKRPIPACHVDRKLISDLEKYLLRKQAMLDGITPDSRWNYRIRIDGKYGSEVLSSIENFNMSYFPDDTKSITISLRSFSSNEISLCFDLSRNFSDLKISVQSENSRQIVEGIASETFQILNSYKTRNDFFHPSIVIELLIQFSLWILISIAFVTMLSGQSIQIAISLLGVSLIPGVYFLFKKFKPYSTFDSRQNQQRERWSSWLMFAVLEFILFTIIGGLILKRIFGY